MAFLRLCLALLLACAACGTVSSMAMADEVIVITHQGVERRAILYKPAMHSDKPLPVIVFLHGFGATAAGSRNIGFEPVADKQGFIVLYPDAMEKKWSYGRPINQPMPEVGGAPVDDAGFINALLDDLISKGIADSRRLYVTGESRGGLMAFTLGCAFSEKLAAIGPMITGMTNHQIADCRPKRPLPLALMAGTNDYVQAYDGWMAEHGRLASVPETLEFWRLHNNCKKQTGKHLPHLNPQDQTRAAVIDWTECADGVGMRFYRLEGAGHQTPTTNMAKENPARSQRSGPRNYDIEAAEALWDFFKQYSK